MPYCQFPLPLSSHPLTISASRFQVAYVHHTKILCLADILAFDEALTAERG